MTDFHSDTIQLIEPLEDQIEILGRELEMAIKWQRPCIFLVVYNSADARDDAQTALENFLMGLHQKSDRIRLKDSEIINQLSFLKEFKDSEHTVFFVDNFSKANNQQSNLWLILNSHRDFLVERRIRVVFWLTQNEVVNFAHFAPDLWAQRHCLVELVEAAKPVEVLQETIESVWLGVGDYAAGIERLNEKVSFCDSLYHDLLQDNESISTRAHGLLNLGILYWRKGDYEAADWLLREALKCAVKVRDNRFEAECFSAIALVKTSLAEVDEAIDAYKQAIHLAPEQFLAWNNLGNLCLKILHNDEAMIAFQKAIAQNPKDPIGWNGLGKVYSMMGYVDDAIIAYRKAISFMATFAQPWNGLGDIYSATGRIDDAIKAYHKAIELNKQYVTPWLRLGVLFVRQEQYRDAIKSYQSALSLDSKNSAIWKELGAIYLKCESYEEAAEVFSKAIQLNYADGWAHHNLALTYTRQEKYSEAVPLFLKSIDLFAEEKDKAVSWNQLANVYRLLNDYDNAIAAYQIADTLDPRIRASRNKNSQERPMSKVNTDKQISSPDAAKGESSNAASGSQATSDNDLRIDQKNASFTPELSEDSSTAIPMWIFHPEKKRELRDASLNVKGTLNISCEQAEPVQVEPKTMDAKGETMSNLMSTSGNRPQNNTVRPNHPLKSNAKEGGNALNADAWNDKGNAYFSRGEMEMAIQAYNRALQLDPSFGRPYSNLALAYLTQGQYAEAILLYERSLELLNSDKDKAVSWNGLGNIYRCINDYENAVAAYQKAAQLDPETAGMRDGTNNPQVDQSTNRSQTWNDLGEAFFKSGTYDKATNAFYKAIEIEPNNGWPYANLARIFVSQAQFEKAIALCQKSIQLLKDDKDKAVVWNLLGNAYRKLNDYDNAVKAYQKAVMLADDGVNLLTRARFSLLSNCDVD
jgi:tetratricopeptide (TPR) repeat protein